MLKVTIPADITIETDNFIFRQVELFPSRRKGWQMDCKSLSLGWQDYDTAGKYMAANAELLNAILEQKKNA